MRFRGTTLPELLLALILVALVLAMGTTQLMHLVNAAAVRQESARLVGALDAVRGAALRLDANAWLTLAPGQWTVSVRRGADTMVAWQTAGSSQAGVTLSGSGAPIVFARSGLAVGAANRTLTLTKGTAVRRVVVSRLGRITP